MEFFEPQVILFVADPEQAARFYETFGFRETFRTTPESPVKIELAKDGFALGLSTPDSARASHGLDPVAEGQRACMTIWTDDVEGAYQLALQAGATDRQGPHPFLGGRLSMAMLEDPDGHPLQLVQKVG